MRLTVYRNELAGEGVCALLILLTLAALGYLSASNSL